MRVRKKKRRKKKEELIKFYLLHKASMNWSTSSSSGIWQWTAAIHRQNVNNTTYFITATGKRQNKTSDRSQVWWKKWCEKNRRVASETPSLIRTRSTNKILSRAKTIPPQHTDESVSMNCEHVGFSLKWFSFQPKCPRSREQLISVGCANSYLSS